MSSNKGAWVEEFRYQISLAESIWKSSIQGKGRIAFVLLDNVIEFMSKCYLKVVKRIVGTGKNKISPNQWHDTSRYFDQLISTMRNHSPLPSNILDSIEQYHLVRNDLYHTSSPMEVPYSQFKEELKNTIVTFEVLFGEVYSSSFIDIDAAIHEKPTLEDLIEIVGSQHIRVNFTESWPLSQWIRIIIHGYTKFLGDTPDYRQIEHSLAISNQATSESRIRAALRKLKFDGDINENSDGLYSLTNQGLIRTLKQR